MLLLAATVYGVLRGEDIGELNNALAQCRADWIVRAAGCVVLNLLFSTLIIWLMLRSREMGPGIRVCFLSACVEFFFSAVTPSSSGGEPMQVYYLRKKGVPVSVSTVSILVMTTAYKLVLIVLGLASAIFLPGVVTESLGGLRFLFWLGLVFFTVWSAFLILMAFHPSLARSIVIWIMSVLEQLHILKNREKRQEALEVAMDMYGDTAVYLRAHPGILAEVFGLTLIRRVGTFSVTWCVFNALGLSGMSWVQLVLLQASVHCCSDMIPLPGAMGISELIFFRIFTPVFGDLVLPAMVLSRGIGHYCQLIVSAGFSMLALLLTRSKKNDEELTEGE